MSSELVPEAEAFCDIFWRTGLPNPNPTCEIHHHPKPQLLMFVGGEGSFEVEVPLNDELYTFTKTTAIWIPAGVDHNVQIQPDRRSDDGNGNCHWPGPLQLKRKWIVGSRMWFDESNERAQEGGRTMRRIHDDFCRFIHLVCLAGCVGTRGGARTSGRSAGTAYRLCRGKRPGDGRGLHSSTWSRRVESWAA